MSPTIPDTPTARAAADLAREAAPQFLLNHSYRTYLFGVLRVSKDVDHESAFIAAMLHDLGLTDAHRGDEDFGEVSAAVTAAFLEMRGWDRGRVRLVERAIVRHTRLVADGCPTTRVVQLGAHVDVAGRGLNRLDRAAVIAVVRSYPRLGFARQMRGLFLDEAARQPRGSFARLERTIKLSRRFGANAIDRLAVTAGG